ncbi:MAG: hypothetical protein IT318_13155 [Anaerolineales bacterium]|nr:hypothetical protein [Anaerolineales bacterium]
MSKPELNWTFGEAPAAGAARGAAPRRPLDARAVRRFCLAAGSLLAVGAVAAGLLVQGGWRRLNTQLAAEAAYEDEHARAGDVALVLALQSTQAALSSEWHDRRAEEAALGLAAPLPAAHLIPDDAAPVVARVEALGGNEFLATVVRTYHDSAGRAVAFALPQRYRNLGPGLWERLPPDLSELQATTVFAGERLSATLPVADLPWLGESLLAADQLLTQACADWGDVCDPDWKLLVRYLGVLGAPPPRRASNASGLGPYPAAFDLAGLAPRYRQALALLSPHLSGLPDDAGARQALTHALTVHGLGYLAGILAGAPGGHIAGAVFRDALAARAELRLGLSPAPTYAACAGHYLPLSALWGTAHDPGSAGEPLGATTLADELPLRLLALDFLDAALAGQPPGADATLLAGLHGTRHKGDLLLWLDEVLGASRAARAASDWQRSAARLQAAPTSCSTQARVGRWAGAPPGAKPPGWPGREARTGWGDPVRQRP